MLIEIDLHTRKRNVSKRKKPSETMEVRMSTASAFETSPQRCRCAAMRWVIEWGRVITETYWTREKERERKNLDLEFFSADECPEEFFFVFNCLSPCWFLLKYVNDDLASCLMMDIVIRFAVGLVLSLSPPLEVFSGMNTMIQISWFVA